VQSGQAHKGFDPDDSLFKEGLVGASKTAGFRFCLESAFMRQVTNRD